MRKVPGQRAQTRACHRVAAGCHRGPGTRKVRPGLRAELARRFIRRMRSTVTRRSPPGATAAATSHSVCPGWTTTVAAGCAGGEEASGAAARDARPTVNAPRRARTPASTTSTRPRWVSRNGLPASQVPLVIRRPVRPERTSGPGGPEGHARTTREPPFAGPRSSHRETRRGRDRVARRGRGQAGAASRERGPSGAMLPRRAWLVEHSAALRSMLRETCGASVVVDIRGPSFE